MPRAFDIFLSYNSRDRVLVLQVHEALKLRDLRPWIDIESLPAGRLWQPEAEKGLRACRAAAVFIGADGIGPWENLEMRVLLTRVAQEGLPLIPVPLPGAPDKLELPPFLAELTWVDLRDGITEAALDRLVLAIPGRKKKKTAPKTVAAGRLPSLHNLTFLPLGDLLKGRDEAIEKLAASLEGSRQAAIVQHRALCGLGGIGKTRLAVEYAFRRGSLYTAAFFVRADSLEGLDSGLAGLAPLLGLPERAAQEETIHAVLGWLRTNPGWLLILDNVDSPEAQLQVRKLLPRLTGGHVLITSRLAGWPPGIDKQSLDTIPLGEASAFLLKRTEEKRRKALDDEVQVGRLAESLDGLPLALEQAGAYINRLRLSFADYRATWESEKERVLTWYDEAVMQYPASVAVTWQHSFDRLHPTAAALLRLSAFLAPDPIPEEMFEAKKVVVEEIVEGEDRSSIREALAELESYSLISRQEATLTVHRVVQEVVQSRIPPERRRAWIEASLKIVNGYSPFQSDDVRTWPVWNVLRPHATRIGMLADEAGVTNPTGRLMAQLASYLTTRGLYSEAEPLIRRSVVIVEAILGRIIPKSPQPSTTWLSCSRTRTVFPRPSR